MCEEKVKSDQNINPNLKELMKLDLVFDDTRKIIKDYFENKKPVEIVSEINKINIDDNSDHSYSKNNIVVNLKEYINTEERMASTNIVMLSNMFALIIVEIILIWEYYTKGEVQVHSVILVLVPILASIISWCVSNKISKTDFYEFKKINYVIDKIESNK